MDDLLNFDEFGVSYDDLSGESRLGPQIMIKFVEYFESNAEIIGDIVMTDAGFVKPQLTDNQHHVREILAVFKKWLENLPDPFLPFGIMTLYDIDPCLTAAQQVIATLPSNKRALFNRFVRIMRSVSDKSVHPLDFDAFFGPAFAKQKTHSFFNFLCRQDCFALSFPFGELKSFLPVEPAAEENAYPDLGLGDCPDIAAIPTPIPVEPGETRAVKLANLYSDAKVRAESFGLTEEVIQSISDISDAEAAKYKQELKHILVQFENEFASLMGTKPSKSDKLPLTALYKLHLDLRKKCQMRTEVEKLREEKALLQKQLNDYRDQFEKTYGHKIQTSADKAPVLEKYNRYREVKQQLAKLECY